MYDLGKADLRRTDLVWTQWNWRECVCIAPTKENLFGSTIGLLDSAIQCARENTAFVREAAVQQFRLFTARENPWGISRPTIGYRHFNGMTFYEWTVFAAEPAHWVVRA